MNPPSATPEAILCRLLDESSALLASPEDAGIAIPDDELHREIIAPLLPAMLADAAIRGHWNKQAATGFIARIAQHLENGDRAPRWAPGDFEIHVTASYSAGADARALADTLLSEESLRGMTASLMNQLLDALWPALAPAPSAAPDREPGLAPAQPVETAEQSPPLAVAPKPPSRALIRALCGKMAASAVQRGLAANRAPHDASAAIVARRILQRATSSRKKKRTGRRRGWRG